MKIGEMIHLETGPDGTISALRIDKRLIGFTMEQPDHGNEISKSCIPTGQYICEPVDHHHYGETWEVVNVPGGRWGIFWHVGNTVDDTTGCILPGRSVGEIEGNRAVLSSGDTLELMRSIIGREAFHLTISDHY